MGLAWQGIVVFVLDVFAAFAPRLRPHATVIDVSTIGPRALAEAVALLPQGTYVIDAPVMGSADRAASGELTLLVGGDTAGFEDILNTFGTVTRAGAPGTGAALKIVMIGAVAVAAAVHATISAHPEAADDDLGQIVARLRDGE